MLEYKSVTGFRMLFDHQNLDIDTLLCSYIRNFARDMMENKFFCNGRIFCSDLTISYDFIPFIELVHIIIIVHSSRAYTFGALYV